MIRRRHRFTVILVAAILAATGLTYMDSNSVAPSSAGEGSGPAHTVSFSAP